MKFLFPSFLWALLAIAIPILIHLLNFRRYKKVYFTNVHLLKEIKLEKNKTDNIKRWLILISRILAITFLVLAFAQPYISKNAAAIADKKRISVYLDNSFSMQQTLNNLPLLEEVKQKAEEIVSSFGISDEFILITNDLSYNQLRWMSQEEMLQEIASVKVSPANLQLSDVSDIQIKQAEASNDIVFEAFVFSDFQKHFSDDIEKERVFQTFLLPVKGSDVRNLYIDSCWMLSLVQAPQTYVKMAVKIVNSGNSDVENRRVTLKVNKEVKAISDVSIPANSEIIDTFSLFVREAGTHRIHLNISDFPIVHDDDFYLNFDVEPQIRVLEVNQKESTPFLSAIFREDSYIQHEVQNVNQINYSTIDNYGLIILNELSSLSSGLQQTLKKYLEKGGSLYIVPPTSNVQELNDFLSAISIPAFGNLQVEEQKVSKVNFDDPIFKGVFKKIQENIDLPEVKKYYLSQQTTNKGISLVNLRNGAPLVTKNFLDKSHVYLQYTPLNIEFSSFAAHALFPAMVYNFALYSQPVKPLYYTISPTTSVSLSNISSEKDNVVKIASKNIEFIPEQRRVGNQLVLFPGTIIRESGHYDILYDNQSIATLSFNYNRSESIFKFLTEEEIKNKYNSPTISTVLTSKVSDLAQISGGIRLWKICLILCLICLAAEIVLIRYFSGRQPTS